MVTSHARSSLSGRSRGYARSADRNVSDHASSASAGGEQGAAHPHHHGAVLLHEVVERAHGAMMPSHVTARSPAP